MENVIISSRKTVFLYLLILLSLGFLGCANVKQVVSIDNQILFNEKENNEGFFRSGRSFTVEYNYSLVGENVTLVGRAYYRRTGYFGRAYYRRTGDLSNIRILFFDATGAVLQQKIVFFSTYRAPMLRRRPGRSFQETLVVPPGAVGISFRYSA